VDFLARDLCGNTDTTRAVFRQIDTIAPNIITCHPNLNIENDPGFCGANVTFQPPRFADDCFETIQSFNLIDSSMVTANAPFGNIDTIVDPIVLQLIITDPNLTLIGNSIDFTFDLINVDADDDATEYFDIFSEDGILLGQTNPTPTQCNSSSSKTLTITNLNQFYSWIADGIIEFTLVPFPASGLDGTFTINNICPDSRVLVSSQFEASIPDDLTFEFAINTNGRGKVKVDPITSFTEFLSVGTHDVTYCITDCAGNIDSCNFQVIVIDTEPPVLTCPSNISINVDSNRCDANFTLPLPIGGSDNCGFLGSYSSTEPPPGPSRFIQFFDNPDLNDYLAMDKFISFSGITGNASGNTGQLIVNFMADMESAGEFFSVIGEDGTVLGTTEVGQAHVTPGDCNTVGTAIFNIPDNLINAWAVDGIINISFVSQTNFNIPVGGGAGLGINPCGPLAGNAPFFELDSLNDTLYGTGHIATHTFNVGTTDVSFFIDDTSGNRDTCTFQVEVIDNENPIANCNPQMVQINPIGTIQGNIDPAAIGAGSTDNCSIANMTVAPSSIGCESIGQTINVQLFVEDDQGNRDSCNTIVRIEGEEPTPSFDFECGSDTLFLFANPPTTSSSTGGFSYQWTGPNNSFVPNVQNPIIINPSSIQSGSYCVEIIGLTGCSSMGCVNIPLDLSPPQPTITGPEQVCWDTDDITLNTTPPAGFGGQVSYNWYAGAFPGTLITSTVAPSFVISAPHAINANNIDNRCFYVTITINGCESFPSGQLFLTLHLFYAKMKLCS